jgi:hypothetical protein
VSVASGFHELLNNAAFWGFLGACVIAFFGYKGAVAPYIFKQRHKHLLNGEKRINVKRVTSFDELKAVVEILQKENERKDAALHEQEKRHQSAMQYAYKRIDELYGEIDNLKRRLHEAHINNE